MSRKDFNKGYTLGVLHSMEIANWGMQSDYESALVQDIQDEEHLKRSDVIKIGVDPEELKMIDKLLAADPYWIEK